MNLVFSYLYKFWLKLKFGNRISIASNVLIPINTQFIIDESSHIEIQSNCLIRSGVELRATKNSTLTIQEEVKLDRFVRIIATNDSSISIGRRCRIGLGTVFNGGANIYVGENTLISGYVYVQTSMHNYQLETQDIIDSGYIYGDIKIGRGCWLGVHAVVFPNVSLGERVIVGSNSVVNKSFEAGSIIGGTPAKRIK